MHNHDHKEHLAELTAGIVSAYLNKNVVSPAALVSLIESVQETLAKLDVPEDLPDSKRTSQANNVKKTVSREAITCLECGKHFKSLRRHLSVHHNLSPEEYRRKWALGSDYPMVAPAYAERRSQLARDMGLGGTSRR
ncbi:MucR family transcriptional regulator [Pseudorhizobium flavum]|uniref:Putative transcriptional regulator n=1 Tax=Pseudorhizobium flavum TaxID=1335061 RepID=A0A7W9Z105_9HYPH|nr:putative transcriptional regulator [Pseudorhizobium flavum]CAD6632218.1 transcriptional regulator [Pseudorhizobium flavum]